PWNFGPSDPKAYSVRWLCDQFATALQTRNVQPPIFHFDDGRDARHEAQYLRLDISKANRQLDWRPKVSIGEAIDRTAAWYAEYLGHGDLRGTTIAQIEEFHALSDVGVG